jgi:hypothetical protein
MISPLAYIHPEAKIGENVEIGPFVFIDKNVVIGDNNTIMPNVNILYGSRIGNNNRIFPGAVIGAIPQENTKPDNEDETNTQKEYDILIENLSQLTQISIKPGMTIAIKNGTYHSQNIYFSGNGAEGQPVTLIAEKPGQVKFIGNSSLTLNGSYLKVNGFTWENPENKQTFVVKFDKNASFCSLENWPSRH